MARQSGQNERWSLIEIFNTELKDLNDYVLTIDGALDKKFDEFGDGIDRDTAGMTEEQRDEHVESLTDEAFQLADRFPAMARKTAFVFLYGLLEHSLLSVCRDMKRFGKLTEEVTGGSEKGITAAKVYFKTVAKLPFPDQSKEWGEILQMAEIRHGFIHRMGRIKGEEPTQALKDYIKKKNGLIQIEGLGKTKLNKGYCEDAIEVIRRFFTDVLSLIPDELLSFSEEDEAAEQVRMFEISRSGKK